MGEDKLSKVYESQKLDYSFQLPPEFRTFFPILPFSIYLCFKRYEQNCILSPVELLALISKILQDSLDLSKTQKTIPK